MIDDQKSGNKLLPRINILQWAILSLVILLGFGIRIYDLKEPPLDFHPVRQLRSALIARSIYYQINPDVSAEMKQQAYDLANLEVYEPPIFEYLVGGAYFLVGSEKLWISRIFLALFWSIGGIALFAMCRRYASFYSALLGLAFYLFLPFGVIASRSFQPEPWMVMWILLTAYALYNWAESGTWKWALMVGLFGGIAVLVKAVAAFFIVGMIASVSISSLGIRHLLRSAKLWVMAILALAPTILFYLIYHQDSSSSFFSFWFGSLSWLVATTEFYADWLAMIKVLMGLAVFMFAILGFLLSSREAKPLLIGAWVGYFIYGLIFPYQYVTHEYYHLPLVALVAVSAPPLLDGFMYKFKEQHWVWRGLAIGVFLFASGYSLYVARSIMFASDYKYEPLSWQRVGEALPENAPFIALSADYGMRLRYYGWRSSITWPSSGDLRLKALSSEEEFNFQAHFDLLTEGKDYFLVTSFSEFDAQPELKAYLLDNYPIYIEGNGFVIYDLTQFQQN